MSHSSVLEQPIQASPHSLSQPSSEETGVPDDQQLLATALLGHAAPSGNSHTFFMTGLC